MKILTALMVFYAGILSVLATGPEPPESGIRFEDFLWKNRLVVLTAPLPDDPLLKEQLELFLGEAEGLKERDLRIIRIHKTGQDSIDSSPLNLESVENILQATGLNTESFTFTLFGKDGTPKLSSPTPVPVEKLYAVIDRMPMRRREIQERESLP